MSNLRLELRFKNARLFEEIEKRFRAEVADKYGCCSLAARTIGVSIGTISSYLTLRDTPWSWADGKESLRPSAQKIADFFLADPYELFPINLYRLRIPRLVTRTIDAERYISFAEARKEKLLPASTDMHLEDAVSADEMRDRLESVLKTLTPREEQILKLRFGFDGGGERTLEECGERLSVTRGRIRQIESKALRKLRHPSRVRKLRQAFSEL